MPSSVPAAPVSEAVIPSAAAGDIRTVNAHSGYTVLAGAQSLPDGEQWAAGVDRGSDYDGKHDWIEPKRRKSYSAAETAPELAVLRRSAAGVSPSIGKRIVGVRRDLPDAVAAGDAHPL
jgi:hypothetical protein